MDKQIEEEKNEAETKEEALELDVVPEKYRRNHPDDFTNVLFIKIFWTDQRDIETCSFQCYPISFLFDKPEELPTFYSKGENKILKIEMKVVSVDKLTAAEMNQAYADIKKLEEAELAKQ